MVFRGDAIELPRDRPLLIGRGPDCDIIVDSAIASRTHCSVSITPRGVVVEDLKSSNGVFVNGERVKGTRELLVGDRMAVGNEVLTLYSFGAPNLAQEKSKRPTARDLDREKAGPPSSMRERLPVDEADIPTQRTHAFDAVGRLADRMSAEGRLDTAEKILTGHIFAVLRGERDTDKAPDEVIESASRYALKLASARLDGAWVDRVLEYHLALRRPLSAESLERVRALLAHRVAFDAGILARYKTVLRKAIEQGVLKETVLVRTIFALESPR
jgi:predicted component of type VI protein secretion system